MSVMPSRPLPNVRQFLSARGLSKPSQRRLIIENCLIQSQSLRNEGRLCIGDFDDLRFACAIASDRSVQVTLCECYSLTGQPYACGGCACLRLGRVKLLREATHRHDAFILSDLHAHPRLAFFAAADSPIEERNV